MATTQMEAIVDLLRKHGRQHIDDMENILKIDRNQLQGLISKINHRHTGKWSSIQIHRTGKKGNSSYELQDGNTDFHVVKKTMNRHGKSIIKHGRNFQEISTLAMVNAQDINERRRIAAEMAAERNQLRQQIQVELHN